MPGATDCNSKHVKNYPSAAEGSSANAKTLQENFSGYSTIRDHLSRSADPVATAKAIVGSAWGTGSVLVSCAAELVDTPGKYNEWGNLPIHS